MGTEFEYAFNLLANSPITNSRSSKTNTISSCGVNGWEKPRAGKLKSERRDNKGGISGFRDQNKKSFMDHRNEEIPNIESIKKTMQIHEEIFRQQVRELHRLYNVQKTLMDEARKQIEQTRSWAPLATTPSVTNVNSIINWPVPSPRDDPRLMEHTRNLDLGRPRVEVSTETSHLMNNDMGCSVEEEHDVELTLSIGGKMSTRKPNIKAGKKNFDPSLSMESDQGGSISSAGTSDQERKQPHWLFKV